MTWIVKPKQHRTPEMMLPDHGGETGLLWLDETGAVWETRKQFLDLFGQPRWHKVPRDRAMAILEEYGMS